MLIVGGIGLLLIVAAHGGITGKGIPRYVSLIYLSGVGLLLGGAIWWIVEVL